MEGYITILLILLLWIIYGFGLKKLSKDFKLSLLFLPLLIIMIMLTIDFGVNYVASGSPLLNDGIQLHGLFSRFFFGDERWSTLRFWEYYKVSALVTSIMTILFSVSILLDKRRAL